MNSPYRWELVFLPNQKKSKVLTKVGTDFRLHKRKIKNSIEAKLVLLAKPKGNQCFDDGCLQLYYASWMRVEMARI